jgi:hypothetical protein
MAAIDLLSSLLHTFMASQTKGIFSLPPRNPMLPFRISKN